MVQYSGFSVHRDICICDSHKSLSQSRDLGELTWLCHHTIQPTASSDGGRQSACTCKFSKPMQVKSRNHIKGSKTNM